MRYIRTKDGRIITLKDELIDNADLWIVGGKENILKIANNIEDLIQEGDLVKYEDRTTSYPYQTTFAEITKFFKPYHTAIYRIIELYIKQPNGDYKLFARDKGKYNYKLELV